MNDMAPPAADIPAGFGILRLPPNGFIDTNGPIYLKLEDGKAVLGLRIESRHCNLAGVCHGGMLATFADMLLGVGSNIDGKLPHFLPTIHMDVDFLAPGRLGAWIEGRLQVLRVTRGLVFSQGIVTDEGTPLLRTSGILKLSREPDSRLSIESFLK